MANERPKLSKNQKVEVNSGEHKGALGVVVSSYMQNKYATYVVRLEGDLGLMHGRVESFTPVKEEKVCA